jgi:hypothetical protein
MRYLIHDSHSSFQRKMYIRLLVRFNPSHLTSCTPTKSNLPNTERGTLTYIHTYIHNIYINAYRQTAVEEPISCVHGCLKRVNPPKSRDMFLFMITVRIRKRYVRMPYTFIAGRTTLYYQRAEAKPHSNLSFTCQYCVLYMFQ